MSINVPSYLLRHSETLKINVDLTTFSDRQLKNIVKQVSTGAVSNGATATSRLAREIARAFNTPHLIYSNWYIEYRELEPTHPLYEAGIQACALAKLETDKNRWTRDGIERALQHLEGKHPNGGIPMHYMSSEGKRLIKDVAKVHVPVDHEVHAYLAKILNREIGTIELDLRNG